MGTVFSYCDSRLEVPPVAAPPPCTSAKVHLLSHFVEVRTDASQMSAIAIKDLWFSYEVAEVIGGTAKTIDKSAHESLAIEKAAKTRDGGLSVDAPRRQHDAGMQLVQKLQLAKVNMELPKGARCMLIGANGAGKSTLMNVIGGKHMVEKGSVQVLDKAAFYDTSLQAQTALLTGTWAQSVNFVGHNVPYQAMEVSTMIKSHSVGVDPARLERWAATYLNPNPNPDPNPNLACEQVEVGGDLVEEHDGRGLEQLAQDLHAPPLPVAHSRQVPRLVHLEQRLEPG